MRFLFIAHRTAPFPGGTEIYVQAMAEESLRRGHEVAIFSGQHQGDYNQIRITDDTRIFAEPWDLIIVHGGDVSAQNLVLSNAKELQRFGHKILYMIILPSHSAICTKALHDCDYIGCSTEQDYIHCNQYNVTEKAVKIRHGIDFHSCIGNLGFKKKYHIDTSKKMFLSCGGYWPNKMMIELAQLFEETKPKDSILVTTGYDNSNNLMPNRTENVIPLLLNDRTDVLSAIKEADCLIMHSSQEGFGLVLLEAAINKTPWIARQIAGAKELKDYGHTYNSDVELKHELLIFNREHFSIDKCYDYVLNNHSIKNTIDDIESIFK